MSAQINGQHYYLWLLKTVCHTVTSCMQNGLPLLRAISNLRSSLLTPKSEIFVCWLFVLMEPCWHIYCLQICHTEWNMHQKCETNGTMPCSFWPEDQNQSQNAANMLYCFEVSPTHEFQAKCLLEWNYPSSNKLLDMIKSRQKMPKTKHEQWMAEKWCWCWTEFPSFSSSNSLTSRLY